MKSAALSKSIQFARYLLLLNVKPMAQCRIVTYSSNCSQKCKEQGVLFLLCLLRGKKQNTMEKKPTEMLRIEMIPRLSRGIILCFED